MELTYSEQMSATIGRVKRLLKTLNRWDEFDVDNIDPDKRHLAFCDLIEDLVLYALRRNIDIRTLTCRSWEQHIEEWEQAKSLGDDTYENLCLRCGEKSNNSTAYCEPECFLEEI